MNTQPNLKSQRNGKIIDLYRGQAPDTNRSNASTFGWGEASRNSLHSHSASYGPFDTPTRKTGTRSSLVERLAELVMHNIDDENYGIAQLGRDAGASRTTIHQHVKRSTGLSTTYFIRAIRMRRAKILLETTELNISQVAYEVGFKDSHYFSRAFKANTGICPREFRKRLNREPNRTLSSLAIDLFD